MSLVAPVETAVRDLGRAGAVAVLRRATIDPHRQLEGRLSDLMSPDLTFDRYGSLLRGFASLHQSLEAEIDLQLCLSLRREVGQDIGFDERRRVPSLRKDLERLGVSMPAAVPFRLTSLSGALGALYVCEGATLGGRVVAAHVLEVLGAEAPVAFFTSYGPEVPRMWAACRRVLDRSLNTRPLIDEAADSAVAVFELFAQVLR